MKVTEQEVKMMQSHDEEMRCLALIQMIERMVNKEDFLLVREFTFAQLEKGRKRSYILKLLEKKHIKNIGKYKYKKSKTKKHAQE